MRTIHLLGLLLLVTHAATHASGREIALPAFPAKWKRQNDRYSVEISLPALDEREKGLPGTWRGIFSVDVRAGANNAPARDVCELRILDSVSGKQLGRVSRKVDGPGRLWLPVSRGAKAGKLTLELVGQRLHGPRFCRVHAKPTAKLRGATHYMNGRTSWGLGRWASMH